MAYTYSITNQSAVYFLTCTVANRVDVFTRKDYSDIVEDSLNFCTQKGLIVYGYIIMSNYVHLLLQAKNNNLSDVLHDFKKFTSQRITDAVATNEKESRKKWMLWLFKQGESEETSKTNYQFWQPNNGAELCFNLPWGKSLLIFTTILFGQALWIRQRNIQEAVLPIITMENRKVKCRLPI